MTCPLNQTARQPGRQPQQICICTREVGWNNKKEVPTHQGLKPSPTIPSSGTPCKFPHPSEPISSSAKWDYHECTAPWGCVRIRGQAWRCLVHKRCLCPDPIHESKKPWRWEREATWQTEIISSKVSRNQGDLAPKFMACFPHRHVLMSVIWLHSFCHIHTLPVLLLSHGFALNLLLTHVSF